MADEISNKTLAILVVAAIVVTLGGTMLVLRTGPSAQLTGFATTQQGTASLNISEVVSILLTNTDVDFGTGSINDSAAYTCTMDTLGTASSAACLDGWAGVTQDDTNRFVIQNDGNVNVNLTMTSGDGSAAAFIGGSSPAYNYQSAGNNGGTCTGAVGSWTAMGTSKSVCTSLAFGDSVDEAVVNIQVTVPADATPEQKTDTVTFTAIKA